VRKGRTQTGKIRDKIERVKSSAPFVRGKSSAFCVRGYLHQDLVSSKTENRIGFSITRVFFNVRGEQMKAILKMCMIIMVQVALGYSVTPKLFADEIDANDLFKRHCVVCHGEDGKGKTDLGEGLGARDFTNKEFQDSITDERITEQITNGSEKMFPFKDKLTPEEIKALIPVIRAFGGK